MSRERQTDWLTDWETEIDGQGMWEREREKREILCLRFVSFSHPQLSSFCLPCPPLFFLSLLYFSSVLFLFPSSSISYLSAASLSPLSLCVCLPVESRVSWHLTRSCFISVWMLGILKREWDWKQFLWGVCVLWGGELSRSHIFCSAKEPFELYVEGVCKFHSGARTGPLNGHIVYTEKPGTLMMYFLWRCKLKSYLFLLMHWNQVRPFMIFVWKFLSITLIKYYKSTLPMADPILKFEMKRKEFKWCKGLFLFKNHAFPPSNNSKNSCLLVSAAWSSFHIWSLLDKS